MLYQTRRRHLLPYVCNSWDGILTVLCTECTRSDKKMSNTGKALLISAFPGLSVQNTVGPRTRHAKRSINSSSQLLIAAGNGEVERVRQLLIEGANVNVADREGQTPLILAVKNGHTRIVQVLLARRADANHAALDGKTPLLWAAARGHTDIVNALLARGADPNHAGPEGQTPLDRAAEMNHMEIVRALIRARADPNLADERAEGAGHMEIRDYLRSVIQERQVAVIRSLLFHNLPDVVIELILNNSGLRIRWNLVRFFPPRYAHLYLLHIV